MLPFGTVTLASWARAVGLEIEQEAVAILHKQPAAILDDSLLQDTFLSKIEAFEADPLTQAAGLRGEETYRTNGRQAWLRAEYEAGRGGVAALPGSKTAYHQIGRAKDYWPYPLGTRATEAEAEIIFAGLVPTMRKYGLKNLASIGDANHVEDLDPLNP